MDKIKGNYTGQQDGDFPLDAEALEYIRDNGSMAEMVGNTAGNRIILRGCGVSGTSRAAGYVFLRTTDYPDGEVLRFEGGTGDTIYLKKENISVTAEGKTYAAAHEKRSLVSTLIAGAEQFAWADFARIDGMTNRDLRAGLQERVPVGMIMLYPKNTAPNEHWLPCDGNTYQGVTYPDLYELLKASSAAVTFATPNITQTAGCRYYIYAGVKNQPTI